MNESLQEAASLYVLDQLDAAARADFEARFERDPELAAYVRDLEAGLARGINSLPRREPPTELFGRIEAAIDAGEPRQTGIVRSQSAPQPSPVLRPLWAGWAGWGLAAVIAVSLATLAVQSIRGRAAEPVFVVVGLDAGRATFTDLPAATATRDPDARFIQLASLADNYWRNPGALPVNLSLPPGDSRGYAVFDPASRQGFIAIEQLPPLPETQRYKLWVADTASGRVRDAGTLPLRGASRGLYSFALDSAGDATISRPQLFVTAEDAGSTPDTKQPHGKVVLGARSL